MNYKINIILIIACLSVVMFVSCKSNEQKTDAAFEQVKEDKKFTNDSSIINNAMKLEKSKSVPIVNKAIPDERSQFKTEMAKKIKTNQNKINRMKSLPNAGLNRKMTSLETDNNDLILKLDEYNKDEKLKWELFKATMNQHADEIGIELKAIKINNKK